MNNVFSNNPQPFIQLTSTIAYLENNTWNNLDSCEPYCMEIIDTSFFIQSDDKVHNIYNFTHIDHSSDSRSNSICINESISNGNPQYFTFGSGTDNNNTDIVFIECYESEPYKQPSTNISIPIITVHQQQIQHASPGALVGKSTTCDNTSSCVIICNNSVSCFLSDVFIYSLSTNIFCRSIYACGNIQLFALGDEDEPLESLNIICSTDSSCSGSSMTIEYVDNLRLECVDIHACTEVSINITNSVNASIICHKLSDFAQALQMIVFSSKHTKHNRYGSCDSIRVRTDNDNTTLKMHDFSENVLFETPTGYNQRNLICNPDNAYFFINSDTTLSQAINEIYSRLSCEDTHFICNETESCDMTYVTAIDVTEISTPFINCYGPIQLDTAYDTRCIGTCPQSPTEAPTNAPTFSPTAQTSNPSSSPTSSPSLAPSKAPSITPSSAPTYAPTYTPSSAPSNVPSSSPSASPSLPPTVAPSISPSESPVQSPTSSPSSSPTESPSTAPTESPIASKDFDSYIEITYILKNVNDETKATILNDPQNETLYIEWVIKREYFSESLSYQHFMLNLIDIEGTKIEEFGVNTEFDWLNLKNLNLNVIIECNQDDNNVNYCASIQQQSRHENHFYGDVSALLKGHYSNNQDLEFAAGNGDAVTIVCKECDEESPSHVVLYSLASVVALLFILAICALLFNMGYFPHLPPFNVVDDAKWAALIIFGLQFWYDWVPIEFSKITKYIDVDTQ